MLLERKMVAYHVFVMASLCVPRLMSGLDDLQLKLRDTSMPKQINLQLFCIKLHSILTTYLKKSYTISLAFWSNPYLHPLSDNKLEINLVLYLASLLQWKILQKQFGLDGRSTGSQCSAVNKNICKVETKRSSMVSSKKSTRKTKESKGQ